MTTRTHAESKPGKAVSRAQYPGRLERRAKLGESDLTSVVGDALRSPDTPLDGATRAFMESRLRHDFGRVRIHADAAASDSARALGAAAYTLGTHIVFREGRYRPDTEPGRRLLAHELTHVAQQRGDDSRSGLDDGRKPLLSHPRDRAEREADLAARTVISGHPTITSRSGGATALIHRADEEWAKAYGTHKSFLQKPFEEFKAGLGEIRTTTKGGLTENKGRPLKERPKGAPTGTAAAPRITLDVLKEIYTGLGADVAADGAKETKAAQYVEHLNRAFDLMKIDTVEAQAVYLAHAFIESDQFRQFTETQGSVNEGAQKWMDDPTKVQLNRTDLAGRYRQGGSVNPLGEFEFIGRGPVQVTHKAEYVEVVAMLEKAADQYAAQKGDAKAQEYAALARKAARDIKIDPRKAADPEYTFLVSAAFMKKRGADVSAATVRTGTAWTGEDAASGWVAGGKQAAGSPQAQALIDKSSAFDKIYPVLLREAKRANAVTATQP